MQGMAGSEKRGTHEPVSCCLRVKVGSLIYSVSQKKALLGGLVAFIVKNLPLITWKEFLGKHEGPK